MKKFTIIASFIVFLVSCQKQETIQEVKSSQTKSKLPELSDIQHLLDKPEVEEVSEEVFLNEMAMSTIAKKKGNGHDKVYLCIALRRKVLILKVPRFLVPLFEAFGAKIIDEDNDGYTASDCCFGSQDDCDDKNASVNPGSSEVCANSIDDNCNGQVDESCGLAIGDAHEGGIIFSLDNTGTHGYVISENDISVSNNFNNTVTQIAGLTLNGYSDWVLPDTAQLREVYNNAALIPNLSATPDYWSSVELSTSSAASMSLGTGVVSTSPKFLFLRSRAVRAF